MADQQAASAAGVATVSINDRSVKYHQITIHDITTGTGTATITVVPDGSGAAQSIVDGTIDLTAPIALIVQGSLRQVIATGPAGDAFTLTVS